MKDKKARIIINTKVNKIITYFQKKEYFLDMITFTFNYLKQTFPYFCALMLGLYFYYTEWLLVSQSWKVSQTALKNNLK